MIWSEFLQDWMREGGTGQNSIAAGEMVRILLGVVKHFQNSFKTSKRIKNSYRSGRDWSGLLQKQLRLVIIPLGAGRIGQDFFDSRQEWDFKNI